MWGPVKCLGCKASVQIFKAGGAISTNSPQVAQTVAAANSVEPWYYGFMVGMGILGTIYLFREGSRGDEVPLGYFSTLGATFLGAVMSYSVSLVLADIGGNVRRASRQPLSPLPRFAFSQVASSGIDQRKGLNHNLPQMRQKARCSLCTYG